MAQVETNPYLPDANFHTAITAAVEPYFYPTRATHGIPTFHLLHLLHDNPGLLVNPQFLVTVLTAANVIYDRSIRQLECKQAPLPVFSQTKIA